MMSFHAVKNILWVKITSVNSTQNTEKSLIFVVSDAGDIVRVCSSIEEARAVIDELKNLEAHKAFTQDVYAQEVNAALVANELSREELKIRYIRLQPKETTWEPK
jgi:hypothetical protein